ncbi:hypothetical protein Rsub_13277, partial [Raphidocelis subcapitata]
MSEYVVLGVACLGPTSRAVVLDATTGCELAAAEGPNIPGWFTAEKGDNDYESESALWVVVDAALAAAGRPYASVAGGTLAKRLPEASVTAAQPLASAVLAAATGGVLRGVALIADVHTEAIAFAGGGERVHRTSGWGPAFMD